MKNRIKLMVRLVVRTLLLLSALHVFCLESADPVYREGAMATWSNVALWRDTSGKLLQTGDGNVLHASDGLFYMVGNRYECYPKNLSCFAKVFNTSFALYSTPDLEHWTLNTSSIFPQMHHGRFNSSFHAYAEPSLLYNKKYDHYVLWFTGTGFSGTNVTMWSAVSKSPAGPFIMVDTPHQHPSAPGQFKGTQMDFWTDTRASEHEAWMHHNVAGDKSVRFVGQAVTKLSDDFLHTTHKFITYSGGFLEGGGIFERKGKWYSMAGTPCCLCDTGASAEVFMAPHPLGPWKGVGNIIAPVLPTRNVSRCGFEKKRCTFEIKAQQFGVIGLGDSTRIYVGQRWGSAPLKCYDGQYWGVLSFDEQGLPLPLKHESTVTVKLPEKNPW